MKKENITLKKTIDRLSKNLNAFKNRDLIMQDYLTIEAAVFSENGKMPLPVYEKVFSAAESEFVSETHKNLCCPENLSQNFSPKCVRTLDRGFDVNDYYRYFLKHGEIPLPPKDRICDVLIEN